MAATLTVYQPSVYDQLPHLMTASESFLKQNPEEILQKSIG